MKLKEIGILYFLLLPMQAHAGTEGHGGDELRLLFQDGRIDAFQKISQTKRCSLPTSTDAQVADWVLKHKNRVATDVLKSQHVWITDQQSTCAFTQVKPEFDITLSFQACGNVKTKEAAGRLLTHESVHHLGISDESFADAVAFAIYAADPTKSCNPPATDPFDPLSCDGEAITLDQVRHVLKPNVGKIKIGQFKAHSRYRVCETLGGCTDWTIGNNTNYKQIGLGWSDGTPVDEKQLVGHIDIFNNKTYVMFGLTAVGDVGGLPLESNGLSIDGFFDGNNPRGSPISTPKFNGLLQIKGEWAGRTRYLTSFNSWNYEAGVFTETNITNTCVRTKWSYSTSKINPDAYSETEVVIFGNLDL